MSIGEAVLRCQVAAAELLTLSRCFIYAGSFELYLDQTRVGSRFVLSHVTLSNQSLLFGYDGMACRRSRFAWRLAILQRSTFLFCS